MRQHQSDRLRVLVLDEVQKLAGIGAFDEVERERLAAGQDAIHDLAALIGPERSFQDFASVVDTSGRQSLVRPEHFVELRLHRFQHRRRHPLHTQNLDRDAIDIPLVKPSPKIGREFAAQRNQQRRHLLASG